MAQNEADREDLIREAVALPERIELKVPGFAHLITIGFRITSEMSVFIGQDPVFQFDPDGRLRRAFVDGHLFRSEHRTLAKLQRVRTESKTQLLRQDLDEVELVTFRAVMRESLAAIAIQIKSGRVEVLRVVPQSLDLLPRIEASVEKIRQADPWLSRQIRGRMLRSTVGETE